MAYYNPHRTGGCIIPSKKQGFGHSSYTKRKGGPVTLTENSPMLGERCLTFSFCLVALYLEDHPRMDVSG